MGRSPRCFCFRHCLRRKKKIAAAFPDLDPHLAAKACAFGRSGASGIELACEEGGDLLLELALDDRGARDEDSDRAASRGEGR